jgi:membrane protein CcdC involved in cytochrome C biogenesis
MTLPRASARETRPPGHGTRVLLASLAGLVGGFAGVLVVIRVVFWGFIQSEYRSSNGGKMWWILLFAWIVVGSTAYSVVFKLLERRARRASTPRAG